MTSLWFNNFFPLIRVNLPNFTGKLINIHSNFWFKEYFLVFSIKAADQFSVMTPLNDRALKVHYNVLKIEYIKLYGATFDVVL